MDFNSLEVFCEGSSIGSLGSVLDGRVLGGSGLLSGTFSTAIKINKSSVNMNFNKKIILDCLLVCCIGSSTSFVIICGGTVMVCNSCLLLQNGVVQRQADPEIPASGSETSLKLQSGEGLKGLSMGPKTTDLGKHSLRTAVSVEGRNEIG